MKRDNTNKNLHVLNMHNLRNVGIFFYTVCNKGFVQSDLHIGLLGIKPWIWKIVRVFQLGIYCLVI